MLKLPSFLLAAAVVATLHAEPPALLNDALLKVAKDQGRWAYTETDVWRNGKDHVLMESVVRFDPSKPYPQQYTPIEINGHRPGPADLLRYRERGEKRGRMLERAEAQGRAPGQTLGDLVDIDRASLFEEDADSVTYEVPLREKNNQRFPPAKFQVLIRVGKAGRALEHVSVHLRQPLRMVMVVNVKSGELDVDFAQVDPRHSPAMTAIRGDGRLSVLFVPLVRSGEMTRTEFKHVRPFDEQFGVQVGPIKALDF